MARLLTLVLFLLFAVGFFGVANGSVAAGQAEESVHASMFAGGTYEKGFVSSSKLPYLSEAELAGGCTPLHQITWSRVQRTHVLEYSLSLKALVHRLASREAALSHHWGRIYDTTTSYHCHPASQYYVFALRRILI